jgi:hypothetical protein
MLIQMLVHQPQMLVPILKSTPTWVWGLLAGLVALGLSQAKARTAGLARVAVMPLAMIALSVWGTSSAFGGSPQFASALLAWLAAAALACLLTAPMAAPRGTHYDPSTRQFRLPGSWWPLLLILPIFLVKYGVGVDLAMQPALARDPQYALAACALYGLFTGIFIGRAARLWRLAFGSAPAAGAAGLHEQLVKQERSRLALQRNPW